MEKLQELTTTHKNHRNEFQTKSQFKEYSVMCLSVFHSSRSQYISYGPVLP